jgi:hypothetical protein
MRHRTILAVLVAGISALPAFSTRAATSVPFAELSGPYESIRLTLLEDSISGVAEDARLLSAVAANLREDLVADRSGAQTDDRDALAEALAEIEASAARLVEAGDLETAREELFVLTRPMAKYRKLTGDQTTVVAYCSMAQKAWIQPQGELGNPYMGQRMPRCGEVVGES